MSHNEHHRKVRWSEETHMLIAGSVAVGLIFAALLFVGRNAPAPDAGARAENLIHRGLEK